MVNIDPQTTKAPPMGTSFEDFQAQAESQNFDISWNMKSTLDGKVYTLVNISGEVGCFFFIDGQGRVSEEQMNEWIHNKCKQSLTTVKEKIAHVESLIDTHQAVQAESDWWEAKGELGSLSEVKEALLKEHGSDEYIFIDHLGAAAGDEFVSDPEKKSVYIIPWANEATADELFHNIGFKSKFAKGEDLTLALEGEEFVLTPKDACELLTNHSHVFEPLQSEGDVMPRASFMLDLFDYLKVKSNRSHQYLMRIDVVEGSTHTPLKR